MNKLIMLVTALLIVTGAQAQNSKKTNKMKLNAGIVTTKLAESKAFYTDVL